jgi:membrane protein YdbS with pleckstrin-like domain
MGSLVLIKAVACLVVIMITVDKSWRSRSSFALAVFYVHVRICFLFLEMPMRVVSEKSRARRVGLHTGSLWLRAPMDGILF